MKQCYKCKEIKPIVEFSLQKASSDGHHSYCKQCVRTYDAERRHTNAYRAKERAYSRLWRATHPDKVKEKNIKAYERHKEAIKCANKQYRKQHDTLRVAHNKIRNAKGRGQLTPPTYCYECGKNCTPDAHHEDYSKPFEVTWLCRLCHRIKHRKVI